MSQELEEKVARAIYEADDPWHVAWPWPNLNENQAGAEGYRRAARAALAVVREAMAEPTPRMIEFGEDIFDRNGDSLAVCWRAMLSASPLGTPEGGAK